MYVYLLENQQGCHYVGVSADVKERVRVHNAGGSPHTAKHRPWRLVVAIWFEHKQKALDFERYLKSGSGRSFARRHFW